MQRSPGLTWLSIPSFEEGDGIKPTLHLQWYAPGGNDELMNVLSHWDPSEVLHLFGMSQMLWTKQLLSMILIAGVISTGYLHLMRKFKRFCDRDKTKTRKEKWYSIPAHIYSPLLIRTLLILQWKIRSRFFLIFFSLKAVKWIEIIVSLGIDTITIEDSVKLSLQKLSSAVLKVNNRFYKTNVGYMSGNLSQNTF